jgi:hypothetical protein
MVARLGLASHTISIERVERGNWSKLASGGTVLPEEAIRYSAHFGFRLRPASAVFEVFDSAGTSVWGPVDAQANIPGNAWIDATAPIAPGVYTLAVAGETPHPLLPTTASHDLTRTFNVSPTAPAHPDPGATWPKLPSFAPGDLLSTPWTWLIILGLIIALPIFVGVVL